MGIGYRIKEARDHIGITQTELGKIVGVTSSAITNYENETSHPKEAVMYKLIEALKVDANYLFQDCVKLPNLNDVTLLEYENIKKYRRLDDFGKKHIDYELDREIQRMEQSANMGISEGSVPTRIISYFQRLTSVESGGYLFDDMPTDMIKVQDTPNSRKADFVICVNGDSMEPDYHDGEKVFVEKTPDVAIGEVGVFVRGNGYFMKERGKDGLISRNAKYPGIEPFSDGITTVGKVIGKVTEIN